MMIRDKNNIFERVENFHADLAWNYPVKGKLNTLEASFAHFSTKGIICCKINFVDFEILHMVDSIKIHNDTPNVV